MRKGLLVVIACTGAVLGALTASAAAIRVFEDHAGPWKASCYREADENQAYCRLMVVKIIPGPSETGNFVQFGPAFDGDKRGIVVATYLGFGRESMISLRVDDGEPWTVKAPAGNHIITAPDLTDVILDRMETGNRIVLTFKPVTSGTETLDLPLEDYRRLLPKVRAVVAGGSE